MSTRPGPVTIFVPDVDQKTLKLNVGLLEQLLLNPRIADKKVGGIESKQLSRLLSCGLIVAGFDCQRCGCLSYGQKFPAELFSPISPACEQIWH